MYVTEGVSTSLGYSQHQMLGQPLRDYVHAADYKYVERSTVHPNHNLDYSLGRIVVEASQSFTMRMKVKLARRNAGFSHDGYKTVSCTGFFRDSYYAQYCTKDVVYVNCQLVDKSGTDVLMSRDTFVLRCHQDLTVGYVEDRACQLLGYAPKVLLDRSIYELVHPDDVEVGEGQLFATIHLIKLPALAPAHPYSVALLVTIIGSDDTPCSSLIQQSAAYSTSKAKPTGNIGYISKFLNAAGLPYATKGKEQAQKERKRKAGIKSEEKE
ncbi:unnamed protein product, partial [Mesorhabditis spiculigera]